MSGSQASTEQNKIKMYATTWCGDCRRSKRWLTEHNVPFENIDIDQDEDAAAVVAQLNNGARSVPTILFPDGSVLVEGTCAGSEHKALRNGAVVVRRARIEAHHAEARTSCSEPRSLTSSRVDGDPQGLVIAVPGTADGGSVL